MADDTTQPKVEDLVLTEAQKASRQRDFLMFNTMVEEKARSYAELDDMTPDMYYESNRSKDLAYLPPKKNPEDVRFASGITREKDTTLLSTLLSMNYQADISAFDNDDMEEADMGDTMSDMVKKSREIEDYETKKRSLLYREYIAQGDVFALEMRLDRYEPMAMTRVDWDPSTDTVASFPETKRRLRRVFSNCVIRRISARNVYVKNMRIENIEDQGAVALVFTHKRSDMNAVYGTWERWKNVPTTLDNTTLPEGGAGKYAFTPTSNDGDAMSEVFLFDKDAQRFQIYLNSIPMLPHDYPLTQVSPSGDIPIAHGKFEPITDFFLSKGQPSKTYIDDDVLSEVTRLMIEGMRQGRKPPLGNKSRKNLAKDILVAGKITPDIKEGQLFPLLQNYGLTAADFSFYKTIREAIDNKTVNAAYSGQGASSADPTATQVQQEKEQQMLKLGLALDGIIAFEKRLTWLRIYSINAYWTTRYDAHMDNLSQELYGDYRKFSVDTMIGGGQRGRRIIRFSESFPSVPDQLAEEQALTKKYGKEIRISYLNPVDMRDYLRYRYMITINPTSRTNNTLAQIVFMQNVRQAMEIFGPDALNLEYVKQRYAIVTNEDYNKFFKKADIMQLLRERVGQEQQQSQQGSAPAPMQPKRKVLQAATQTA